ncbi:MAG: BglII/BstYI family type II restriction endonuclease [Anaerolineaceae bacterium]
MEICDIYNHHNALSIIDLYRITYKEIIEIIKKCDLSFGLNRPKEIKNYYSREFNSKGWADRVKIKNNNNLTINFAKNHLGVCFQFGNIARTYADMLKLTYLCKKSVIEIGILIVPDEIESKKLGANYAQFERLAREIEIFSDIINVPIQIISLRN